MVDLCDFVDRLESKQLHGVFVFHVSTLAISAPELNNSEIGWKINQNMDSQIFLTLALLRVVNECTHTGLIDKQSPSWPCNGEVTSLNI